MDNFVEDIIKTQNTKMYAQREEEKYRRYLQAWCRLLKTHTHTRARTHTHTLEIVWPEEHDREVGKYPQRISPASAVTAAVPYAL